MTSITQCHTDTKDTNNNRRREDATDSPFDVDRLDQLDMQLLAASDHMFEDNDNVSTMYDVIYDVDPNLLDAQSGHGYGARKLARLMGLLDLVLTALNFLALLLVYFHVVSREVVEFFFCLSIFEVGRFIMYIMLKLLVYFHVVSRKVAESFFCLSTIEVGRFIMLIMLKLLGFHSFYADLVNMLVSTFLVIGSVLCAVRICTCWMVSVCLTLVPFF